MVSEEDFCVPGLSIIPVVSIILAITLSSLSLFLSLSLPLVKHTQRVVARRNMLFPYFGMKCKSLSVIFEWLYIKKMGPTKGANNLRWITWLYYSVALFGLWHLVMHSTVSVRQKEMMCYTIFFTIIEFVNFYQLKSCRVVNTVVSQKKKQHGWHYCISLVWWLLHKYKVFMGWKDKDWGSSFQKETLHTCILKLS